MKASLVFILIFINVSAYAIELTESRAISLFMEKNLELMANKYNIEISKAAEISASLWPNPSVLVDSQLNSFNENWNQKNAGGPAQQDVVLTIPLDVNGIIKRSVKIAKFATKGSEAQFQSSMREGLYGMIDSLYKVQRLEREHELLQEKVQLLDKLIITLEKRIGSASNQPLLQSRAKLALEDTKVEVQSNLMDQNEEKNKLRTYLVMETTEEVTPNVTFKTQYSEKINSAELVKFAKDNRPDFIALNLYKQQVEHEMDLNNRRIWDDLALQVGVSRQDEVGARPGQVGSTRLPTATSWMVGVVFPIPVFDRNQGLVLQNKIQKNQAIVKEKFLGDALTKEIETSIKKIELTNLNLNRYRNHQLANAKTVRDSALRQFGTGSTSLIEYLDAIDSYHTTIHKYINAQYDLTSELLKLKLISGQEVRL